MQEQTSVAERYLTKEKATMQLIGKLGVVNASLKNLSRTGACLEWAAEGFSVKEGDLINVTVKLLEVNRRYEMNAQVIWKNGKRTGVQFMTPNMVLERMMMKKKEL